MTAPSIYAFGANRQSTHDSWPWRKPPVKVATGTTCCLSADIFRRYVEALACVKVNHHRWMDNRDAKQATVTPCSIHSTARNKPTSFARRWCYLFLYHHPHTAGTSISQLARLYKRDRKSVLYGLDKVRYSMRTWPDWQEADCLNEINEKLMKYFGPFDIDKAAEG